MYAVQVATAARVSNTHGQDVGTALHLREKQNKKNRERSSFYRCSILQSTEIKYGFDPSEAALKQMTGARPAPPTLPSSPSASSDSRTFKKPESR